MATITDLDNLKRSVNPVGSTPDGNVYIDIAAKKIVLIPVGTLATIDFGAGAVPNPLVPADGVNLQTIYSFLKELWKTQSDLVRLEFPMEAITSEQFEFIKDWTIEDDTQRSYIRSGGWVERNLAGAAKRTYMGVITLGTIIGTHRAYWAFAGATGKTDFEYTGAVNEPVQIQGSTTLDASSPINEDRSATPFSVYIRSAPEDIGAGVINGYTYAQTSTSDIGAGSGVTYQVYRFPLSESVDINITKLDADMASGNFANISYSYLTGTDQLNGFVVAGTYDFSGVQIDANAGNTGAANNARTTEIYMRTQYELRQTTNIGDSSIPGVLADPLVQFVGTTLKTIRQSDNGGVYITEYNLNDVNDLVFVDDTGTEQRFPFYATVNLQFNSNLVDDPNSRFWLFYTSVPSGDFGTTNAVIVEDFGNTQVTGFVHSDAYTPTQGSASGTLDGDITSGTSEMTVTGANWIVDELKDKILDISTGGNAKRYYIESNTVDTITVRETFDTTDGGVSWSLLSKNEDPVTGVGTYTFSFNYDGEEDGGRTKETDAPVTFVAIGLDRAQYVSTTGTITKTANITIPITAPLERNYSDPVNV